MPSIATGRAGACSMHFERCPISTVEILTSLVFYGIGGFLLYVAHLFWTGLDFGSILGTVGFSAMALIPIYGAWVGVLQLEVDLSNNPREALCRRKNAITRIATHHRYKIPDKGKVFIQTSVGGKYQSDRFWPVRITGLPRYYDFFLLGRCRYNNVKDAYDLACTLAGYLGLPILNQNTIDPHEVIPKGEGPYVWYPPAPDGQRGRKRRRRRS